MISGSRQSLSYLDCGPFEGDRIGAGFGGDGDLLVSARNLAGVKSSRSVVCQKTINELDRVSI